MSKSRFNQIILILLGLSFFVGAWHAFPMLNVVNDEMYYVGGVLRAMEHHTIIPLPNDVPYGTLTYLLNYIVTAVSLLLYLPLLGFNVSSLKIFLVQSPWVVYLSLRILSAVLSLGMLFFVYQVVKREFADLRTRLFLVILLFTNMITAIVLHTGKVWVLSLLLVIISFYYLYQSIATDHNPRKNIFLSLIFSFLAASNFPLNVFSLINIPILVFYFKDDKDALKKIIQYALWGALIFVFISALNFAGIKGEVVSIFTDYHPLTTAGLTHQTNFFQSFFVYTIKLVLLFPLILATLLLAVRNKIKDYKLFIIACLYFVVYFLLVAFVANWANDLSNYLRYLLPLGFFLTFIISSFDLKFHWSFYLIGLVSIIFYATTLYYLSVPTTYNLAYNWVRDNLSGQKVLIINKVNELELTKNKESSLLTQDKFCSTKCKNIIAFDLNKDFKPLVFDLDSQSLNISNRRPVYYITESKTANPSLKAIESFTNNSLLYHSVDYNLGSYFDFTFFTLKNLGKNIYIYEKL